MSSSDNANQIFLITGCSSGFGAEMARVALQRGFKVIATARRVDTMQTLSEQGATVMALDVTAPPDELATFAKSAWEIHGRVDYLVNNAGYLQSGAIEENSYADALAQFNTNVFGLVNLTNAFLPYLRARRAGMIVNISSMGGSLTFPGSGMYCASKAAVDSFSDTWSKELAEFGVKCISIQPGMFRTAVSTSTNLLRPSQRIPGYTLSTQITDAYLAASGTERGDPAKAAQRIIDFATQTEPSNLPLRLTIGEDAFADIHQRYLDRLADMERHKAWSLGTDFHAYIQSAR
ncbi:Short-chain dehydrogenase/reductase family protein [Mycena kentingensis (nom. inval.)]|nr:Short-chain dehydrogenase/reductase family protein [Mycena kentingensis (nom. inval.)]